jgi:hypothetical protein
VLSEARIDVFLDPDVALAGDDLQRLFDTRVRAYRQQLTIFELVARLDAAKARLTAAVESSADDSTGVPDARVVLADIDSTLNRLRAAPRRGGQRGGGGGGGGGSADAQPLLSRANGVAAAIGTAHFAPTAEHHSTLDEIETELARQLNAVEEVLARAAEAADRLRR